MHIHEQPSLALGSARRPFGCFGCLSSLFAPLLGLPIAALVIGIIEWFRSASDAAAITAFEACPTITAALGTPIAESALSMGCGESESGGGSGHAQWSLSIWGPKGEASAWYNAQYSGGGPWVITSATVTLADGQTLTAVPCPSSPPAQAPEPRREPDERGRKGKRR